MTPAVRLLPGKQKSLARRHPWIFSGAIGEATGEPDLGETVDVLSSDGTWLARGAFSPDSQIRVRVWTWDEAEAVDAGFLRRRLAAAIARRSDLAQDPGTNAYREVHGESDGLPGLIVDRYGTTRVTQFLSAGAEHWRPTLVEALQELAPGSGIYDRSDAPVRALEGLPPRSQALVGEAPVAPVHIREAGLEFAVDLVGGQKTGFYLDQRDSRVRLRNETQLGDVLNCFAYTGGFTVAALAGGAASVLSIEDSAEAIGLGRTNIELNGYAPDRAEWLQADVFAALRKLRDRAAQFDTILLDPPRFAGSAAQVERAARGYKDINLLAFKLLRPGGTLYTFSCSGAISASFFQTIVAEAALDAALDARIIAWLGQPVDHPVTLAFPEGRYLKGLICRLD
jgi:23S rRNA (cytosine1962-C5)-methyltransferase